MAGLLAFAGPLTFFTGALSVMRAPAALDLARLGLWWSLYGVSLWCLLLITGCTVLLDLSAPSAPHLAVLGLLLGLVISAALAAVTASWTRTGESAQVTPFR